MVASKNLRALEPGNVFRGRYRVVRRIKAGGQGAVYEVKDETTNRPRALKVVLPSLVEDPDMRALVSPSQAKPRGGRASSARSSPRRQRRLAKSMTNR